MSRNAGPPGAIYFLAFEDTGPDGPPFPPGVAWIDGHGRQETHSLGAADFGREDGGGEGRHGAGTRMAELFLAAGAVTCSGDAARDTGLVARLLGAAGHGAGVEIAHADVPRESACLPLLSLLPRRGEDGRKRSEGAVRRLAAEIVGRSVAGPSHAPRVRDALETARSLHAEWLRIGDAVDRWMVAADRSRTGRLFLAALAGEPVVVGHAEETELSALAPAQPGTVPRDTIDLWSLVAFRSGVVRATTVHALGHRTALDNVWITSAVTSVDPRSMTVLTSSGAVYRLGERDGPAPGGSRLEHLAYALRTWGYDIVR